jgi:signal transduction histidine kinase
MSTEKEAPMPSAKVEARANNEAADLVALSRVSAAISSLRDLNAILDVALDNVLSIMNGTAGGILLLDEQAQTLSYQVYRGLSAEYVKEMQLKVGEGIAGKVAKSGRAILLEDISADPRTARPEWVRREGLKAWLSVPLRAKEAVLGVINVASREPHHFTKRDMHLLHSIGDQVGVAVEEARLYEQLRGSRERYRQLVQQVLLAQEEERRRIARELHDETSQSLSGLTFNLQALIEMADMIGVEDAEFKSRLNKVHSLATQIGNEVSRLIADLRPTLLDTLGLVPAIRHYAEANLTPLGINVTFDFEETGHVLPPETEVAVFRWAQGAMGNIMQHSEARNVAISLRREGNDLILTINDDGKGFDVSQLTGIEENGRGAGLFGIKERLRLIGGSCSIQSQPGQGTTLIADVPLVWSGANAEDTSIGG